jgi:O-antigen ligase
MKQVVTLLQSTFSKLSRNIHSPKLLGIVILALAVGMSIFVAYTVVNMDWRIAVVLILAVPALFFLYKYPFAGLLLWLVLMPFLLTTLTSAERQVYWAIHRALPAITVGVIILRSKIEPGWRKLPKLGPAEFAILGYLVISILSIYYQNDQFTATLYQFYDRVLIPVCLYMIVRLYNPKENDIQKIVPVAFFLVISQSAIGILSWIAPGVLPSKWLELQGVRTIGSLESYSVFSVTLIFGGLLLLHAANNMKPGILRTAYILAFALSVYSVFISFSRASWIAGIVVILALILLYPRFMLKVSGLFIVMVMALGILFFSNQSDMVRNRLFSAESERSAITRLPVYYAAIRMFQEKPLFGWGYNNFDRYDRQFQPFTIGEFAGDNKDHASHNLYLSLLAEQGLFGLLLYMAPVFWWIVVAIKTILRMPRAGFWSIRLLAIYWLVIISHIIVNNFSNMRVVYGLGLWWLTVGLIGSMESTYLRSGELSLLAWIRGKVQENSARRQTLPNNPKSWNR